MARQISDNMSEDDLLKLCLLNKMTVHESDHTQVTPSGTSHVMISPISLVNFFERSEVLADNYTAYLRMNHVINVNSIYIFLFLFF